MAELPRAAELLALHDGGAAPPDDSALWRAIVDIHRCNTLLWAEEDLARRQHVSDAEIAANKRAIDAYNQQRNDAIEHLDEAVLGALAGVARQPQARRHSETAGAMIDRLSILALKIRHMRLQTERTEVSQEHRDTCLSRLSLLIEQRRDLAGNLDRLLDEAARGEAWFKLYRQFKMYNDPALNPALYGEAKRPRRS